jgi:hypothetical protein
VIYQVLTAASTKMTAFWDTAACGLVEVDRRFRSAYCLHHQSGYGDSRPYASLKCRSTSPRLHGAISQMGDILMILPVFVCVRNLSLMKRKTQNKVVLKQGTEENIWLKWKEVTGGWRKLRNEELHTFYSSENIIRMITSKMRWAIHTGKMIHAYRILTGKPEGRDHTQKT